MVREKSDYMRVNKGKSVSDESFFLSLQNNKTRVSYFSKELALANTILVIGREYSDTKMAYFKYINSSIIKY